MWELINNPAREPARGLAEDESFKLPSFPRSRCLYASRYRHLHRRLRPTSRTFKTDNFFNGMFFSKNSIFPIGKSVAPKALTWCAQTHVTTIQASRGILGDAILVAGQRRSSGAETEHMDRE